MKSLVNRIVGVALMLGIGLVGSVMRADEDAEPANQLELRRIRVLDRVSANYWIGVHAVPVDEALKSQLNIDARLIIRSVMPDSPGADAGLQQFDILLKFGDRDIKNIEELLKSVAASEGKAVKVVVLRGGKESTLDIQPTERPASIAPNLPGGAGWKPLEAWFGGPAGSRLRIVGPGVFEGLNALPGNLSIDVSRENDDPANITVKRDNETWKITENEIDELPEELREYVRRRLASPRVALEWSPQLRLRGTDDGAIRVFPHTQIPEGVDGSLREQLGRAFQQLEQLQQRMSEDDPFKALQEEMKSLRREFEKLRKRDQPSDPPASDTSDA
ncbi:MAG: PDZ domain-containing protein [Planctomycetes bacterium]|nr:PDZ domain-containing protein [Planctomycetota bacterium]